MMDESHPNIFKCLTKIADENALTEAKVAKCNARHDAPKMTKRYVVRDKAIRTAVKIFDETIGYLAAPSNTQGEPCYGLDSDNDDSDNDGAMSQPPPKRTRSTTAKSPQLVLIESIAHNIRLDKK